jgi:hypothetical protein
VIVLGTKFVEHGVRAADSKLQETKTNVAIPRVETGGGICAPILGRRKTLKKVPSLSSSKGTFELYHTRSGMMPL